MKVVINSCYGGYSLSDEAIRAIAKRKGMALYSKVDGLIPVTHFYTKYDKKDDSYFSPREDWLRTDPDVIAVVEELGSKANGQCASLTIVEVPDDVEWHIEEYDGIESIHENHRVWS